jgi:glycosyltransferase involved in cell wall biosynthesis
MKLIFDLTVTQPIDNIKYHGGGKYGEIVFKAIVRETPEVIAYIDSKKWLNPEIKAICDEQKIQIIDASTISIKDIVNKIPSVVYCPVISNDYNSIADSTIYLTTIHGLRVLEMPYDSYAKYYYKRPYMSLLYGIYFKWKSKKIFEKSLADYRKVYKNKNIHTVTVSEHSKASILNFVPELSADKVKVFYSPATVDLNVNANVEPYSIEKYFLIVGANRWIKNGLRALKAFDELFEERPSFEGKVVVTGVTQKQLFLKHLKHKDRFEFLEYVDNSLLASLYKGAYLCTLL